ncbi:hypothetical protein JTE90_011261 [Oedothorax gibbosus]|uniref:Uncharacterized protein n=1 Tax=Oedothorax gibbosus TaxID=931172 RepID=A0AAV6VYN8_9ARAC|nr:hypothetical protein JTE90_011261 [Oedothorax gibbosus]
MLTNTGNMRFLYAILLISLFAGVLVNEAYGAEYREARMFVQNATYSDPVSGTDVNLLDGGKEFQNIFEENLDLKLL